MKIDVFMIANVAEQKDIFFSSLMRLDASPQKNL